MGRGRREAVVEKRIVWGGEVGPTSEGWVGPTRLGGGGGGGGSPRGEETGGGGDVVGDALKARSKVGDQHPMPKDNNFSECQPQALKSKTRLHGMRHPNTLGNPLPPPPIPSPSSPLPLPPPPLSSPSSPPIRRSATAANGAAGGCRGEWRQAAAN
uniref:Uncharacterized protein n=1 Tax=Oryza nivara TaxID=4536 RepID=A0A0E0I7E5_ORYNI